MGIPRLTQDLATYAEYIQVDRRSDFYDADSVPAQRWVIDGPSLVYDVYTNLVALKTSASASTSVPLPAYQEVNAAVRAYLPTLEQHGIHLEALFFDGALPESKRQVRLERLEKCRRQLEESLKKTPVRRPPPPPQPFLVASAIESLLATEWADRVHVVPEEADVACARAAANASISVVTNDSDLALFPMRPDTPILWLRSLVEMTRDDGTTFVQASSLLPAAIAARLGLSSLLRLGFERQVDSSVTTATVVERARHSSQSDVHSNEYAKFCQEYSRSSSPASSIELSGLDPRTAEHIVQAHTSPKPSHIYFPILHEDSSRDASWSYGVHLRQIGYSIFANYCHFTGTTVIECYRKGPRIAASSVGVLSANETLTAVEALLDTLSANIVTPSGANPAASCAISWWSLAVSILAESKVTDGKLVNIATVRTMLGLEVEPAGGTSLEVYHLHANLQAILYSMRMLKQLLGYVKRNRKRQVRTPPRVMELLKALENMPTVEDLFLDLLQLRSAVTNIGADKQRAMMRPVEEISGNEGCKEGLDEEQAGSRRTKKKKKKKKRKVQQPGETGGRWKSLNTFDLLADGSEDEELGTRQ